MEKIIEILKNKNQTISCMESCTGGLFANELTNIDGASNVFKLGLVSYSNEYKIYFGVPKEIIEKYTVYSKEVSEEMAKVVSNIAKSDFGVGITGQLGTKDPSNNSNNINTVYITIYRKIDNKFFDYEIEALGKNKAEKKSFVVDYIKEKLYGICR